MLWCGASGRCLLESAKNNNTPASQYYYFNVQLQHYCIECFLYRLATTFNFMCIVICQCGREGKGAIRMTTIIA